MIHRTSSVKISINKDRAGHSQKDCIGRTHINPTILPAKVASNPPQIAKANGIPSESLLGIMQNAYMPEARWNPAKRISVHNNVKRHMSSVS